MRFWDDEIESDSEGLRRQGEGQGNGCQIIEGTPRT